MGKYFIDFSQRKVISKIEPTVFGSFLEQLGRAIYNGIYEEGHPLADNKCFRNDVKDAIKDLGVSIIRFPGGNYVSQHEWKHAIGPKEKRPIDLNLAWQERDINQVGIDEFVPYCYDIDVQVMMALNLGTGSFQDVIDIVEYCNIKDECSWALERIKNGSLEPYNIKYWCLGNEMDGEWQICHMSAEDYSKKAISAAQIVKSIDPSTKTIANGSCSPYSAKFPQWDKTVVHETFDYIDYLGVHAYFTYPDINNREESEFFGCPKVFDNYLNACANIIKEEKKARNSDKEIYLSVDEWNVWHSFDGSGEYQHLWSYGEPRLENIYDYSDMIVFSSLLVTLLNKVDYVKMACLAQLVNVIAPIITVKGKGLVKQTTYYPFAILANSVKNALSIETLNYLPTYKTKAYGEVNSIYHNVAYLTDKDEYVVTLINCVNEEIDIDLICKHNATIEKIITLESKDLHAKNTPENPNLIVPNEQEANIKFTDSFSYHLKPFSLNFLYIHNRKE